MKKLLSLILPLLLIFSSITIIKANAASPIKSKSEAITWLNSQQDKTYDFDGAYGTQCTEFVKAYVNYVMTGNPWTDCGYSVYYNGRDVWQSSYWSNNGWTIYENTYDFVPQPGDIFCAGISSYGHTGVVISSDIYTATIAEANARDTNPDNGDPVWIRTISWKSSSVDSPYGATYFIRPNFATYASLVTPTITFGKSSYTVGETVKVSWKASPSNSNLSHYWITIQNPSGGTVADKSIKGSTSFSFVANAAGTYKVKVYATPVGSQSGEGSLTDTKTITVTSKPSHTHTYTVTYTKATLTKNGSITTRCTGCGNLAGSNTIYYPKTLKLSTTAYTYNGKVKTPSVTVKDSTGKKLTKNVDYTVTYATGRKNVGKYKVVIKMKGNYSGTKTLYFKINPPKTSVLKLTAGKKSLTVKISKKTTQVSGYQIQYSTNSKFTWSGKVTTKSANTTKCTIKGLGAKKTYYVRVRTYKKVGGKTYYSGWSTVKYKKTK